MSFTRTASGLGNQFLFYAVDAVVFTEGGKISWSISDVQDGEFNEVSIDIVYWRKIFRTFRGDLKLKFKSVGSKTTVNNIAMEIADKNISRVVAVMDSEFDEIYGKKLKHSNIIYTYGYSWENDLWHQDLVLLLMEDLSGDTVDRATVEKCIFDFHNEIKESVYADAFLFGKNSSFLPRKGHLKCVECSVDSPPRVVPEYIESLFQNSGLNRQDIRKFGAGKSISSELFCYGHLLNDFVYHLVRYLSQTVLKIKVINKELLERLAIAKLDEVMGEAISKYYKQNLKKAVADL